MKLKKITACFMAVVMSISTLSFSAFSASAENESDAFNVLNQDRIVKDMGAGWNVGNQLEANLYGTPDEECWVHSKITKELIQAVKAQGFNTIRIPVSYLSKIGPAPDYTIDTAWLDRVQEVVNYCYNLNMYVILNMHGDGYSTVDGGWLLCGKPESEQTAIIAKYQACWEQIAERFKNYDEHLIFESMNEVGDGDPTQTAYDNINKYNQTFVDTVRQTGGNNSKRWLLIPGWYTNIEYTTGNYGFALPTDTYRDASIPKNEQRIMISVHYYTPWDFCGETNYKVSTWGTNTQIKDLQDEFTKCYISFVSKGYPVVIGEYGSIDKYNETSRVLYASEVCKAARSRGMIPVYWDNADNNVYGFGLFNRTTYAVTQQGIIDAIMKAFEGDPEPFEIIPPITKDKALAVLYHVNKATEATTVSKGTADASMAGAVKARFVFDCASDVSFNQWSNINLLSTISGTESKATVTGESSLLGSTKCTAVLDLTKPIKAGDSFSFSAYTKSWSDAKDYVFLIRCIELLDANGKVIKTIEKNTKTINTSKINPTVKFSTTTTKATRSPGVVVKDKKAVTKAMKQAKIKKLTVNSKSKKKITVTWKKVSKDKGYEVQVSTNKKFKKNKIILSKLTSKKKLVIKNKKIKSGKKYYVRVRAYATYMDTNGTAVKVYGAWNKKLRKITVK